MTDTHELDRLVSKTELTPATKQGLRLVRKAMLSGRASDPEVGSATWAVEVETDAGNVVRFRFSMRRDQ